MRALQTHLAANGVLSFCLAITAGATVWGCGEFVRRQEDLNLTDVRILSRKFAGGEMLDRSEHARLMSSLLKAFELQDDLLAVCPCALVVACALQLSFDAFNSEHGGAVSNAAHMQLFHRMGLYQQALEHASASCVAREYVTWPVQKAVDLYRNLAVEWHAFLLFGILGSYYVTLPLSPKSIHFIPRG